jgi:hypothetical protein
VLFRFFIEKASFGFLVKPKLTETNRNKPKNYSNLCTLDVSCTLPLNLSLLQQPLQPLDMFVLHQPVLQPELPLDVSVIQQPVLLLDLSAQQTKVPGSVSPPVACAVIGLA